MQIESRPLHRQFIRFVIPSVAAQWVFALYTMIDGMFVSRGVSETALAAVNISLPFVNFIFAISLVLAVGTSTIVSIFFGQKDSESANRIYTQNILIVLATGLLITVLVTVFKTEIAVFLGAEEQTLQYVREYIGTVAYFTLFFMLGYYFEILVKADGRPRMATLVILMGAVTNCVLDYVFVFIIKWGVFGAAFATGLSQLAVTTFFLIYFLSSRAKLRFVKCGLSGKQAWRTVRLGLPSGITDFSAGLMIFMFNQVILRNLDSTAIVSYTIVAYVNTIIVMSMTGIAQGAQPLVSYCHGQGRQDLCRRLLRYCVVTAVGLSLFIAIPAWLGAGGIVSIFISADLPELREYSVQVFRIFSLSFLLVGFNVVISGYFTAVEYEKPAMIISLARGIVLIALCLWLLVSILGGEGIWWAPAMSELLCLMISGLFLRRHLRPGLDKSAE